MQPYKHNSGPSLILGIPTLGRPVPLEWAFALKTMDTPTNYNFIMHVVQGKPIDVARCEMAQLALDKGCKYLMFISDDVVCPNHTIRQLIYRMEQDKTIGVVGGVYCTKSTPSEPLVYRGNGGGCYWDWKVGEFFEVTGMGLDCTLIRVDMLREMGKDWFKTVKDDSYLDGLNSAESWTEDLFFYNRVLSETKYKIYCDASVIAEHWDVATRTAYRLPPDSLPMRQKVVVKDKKALMIGPRVGIFEDAQFDTVYFSKDEAADYRGFGLTPFDGECFDWVILTDPGLSTDIHEPLRVCKTGGKITLLYSYIVDVQRVATAIGGTAEGNIVEVLK